jgi:integrative and conjugative element protein (TIGR02256 family)
VAVDDWIMNIPDFGRVRTAHALLEDLCKFRQTAEGHPESGGVLIGKHLIRGGRMVINRFTSPQKRDKHGRFMFYRSKDHDRLVQNIWEESKRISTYVGLWHTHPENVPHYSAIDRRDWNKALNRSAYDGKNLFFFIVGRTHIGCWMGTKKILRNSIKMVGKYEIK